MALAACIALVDKNATKMFSAQNSKGRHHEKENINTENGSRRGGGRGGRGGGANGFGGRGAGMNKNDKSFQNNSFTSDQPVVVRTAGRGRGGGGNRQPQRNDADGRLEVFMAGIPNQASEEDVREFYENANIEILKATLPRNEAGDLKGFGFIEFETSADMSRAIQLDQTEFLNFGKQVSVREKKPKF